jgi:malate dehydrogenase (oxaloacetate-decarboxylating)
MIDQSRKRKSNGDIDFINIFVDKNNLINSPIINKGSAFNQEERDLFLLKGMLPAKIESIDEQVLRLYTKFIKIENNLDKYEFLMQVYDDNLTLFYRFSSDYIEEVLPIIYTPTVGDTILKFNENFIRSRGVYINYSEKDSIVNVLKNYNNDEVDFIIVTDGEAVLGIGDQGVGGINISLGKLMVYIIFSGLDPNRVLPIVLDVGTDNNDLLKDPFYPGYQKPRIRGKEYNDFIDEFVAAVQEVFFNVFLHWEDFGKDTARKNLERYQNQMCTFNDDMQGTGIVTAANILSAVESQSLDIREQRIVMYGAGTASCGIADQILDILIKAGLSEKEARTKFWMLNSKGLITTLQTDIKDFQKPYLRDKNDIDGWGVNDINNIGLEDVVHHVKPSILIGVSTVYNAFNEQVVVEMSKHVDRPIIMPLSNPTSKSEAHPQDIMNWSKGKAVVATGSPFSNVQYNGRIINIAQGNNAYIFPGLGLGVMAAKATRLTNTMIYAASKALSQLSPFRKDQDASLLPPITDIKNVSYIIAKEVALQAINDKVSNITSRDIDYRIRSIQWEPRYYKYNYMKD